jgi:hypothetical protein
MSRSITLLGNSYVDLPNDFRGSCRESPPLGQVFDDCLHLTADMQLEADALHIGADCWYGEIKAISDFLIDVS